MTIESLRSVLLWCTILNYGLLTFWSLLILAGPRDTIYGLWGRWFALSREQLDTLQFAGLMGYKILIFVFNLMPLVALWIVG